ncbi:hypothetical protein ACFL4X_01715 [Gemmatimonadota bacterium]
MLSSKEELKAYNYEPLTTLTEYDEIGSPRTRADLIATLQRRAAAEGANAIAIIDQRELDGEIVRIRVSAVWIRGTKENTR